MAANTKSTNDTEEAAARIRELNERVVEVGKK